MKNIIYGRVISLRFSEQATFIGFADKQAVVVAANIVCRNEAINVIKS